MGQSSVGLGSRRAAGSIESDCISRNLKVGGAGLEFRARAG